MSFIHGQYINQGIMEVGELEGEAKLGQAVGDGATAVQ